MSAPARLATFALALVAALGLGLGLGAAFGPEPSTRAPAGPEHDGGTHTPAPAIDRGAAQVASWVAP